MLDLSTPATSRQLQTEQLTSDNYAGICPEALDYLLQANLGSAPAYGNDAWTQQATDRFRELFEIDCEVFFVFNGTAANSLSLATLCQSYHSVIGHELAHIETSECGAPEFFSNGSKLLLARGKQGKLTPEAIATLVNQRHDIHYPKPKVISITQATEAGTLYSIDELLAIQGVAQRHQLKIHMDGARFANAVAALEKTPAELTWKVGIDVLCFSGTKNGLAFGEAIVFFNQELAEDFAYRCKQAGQLASKMRFIAAPWLGLLETGAWLNNARHANDCAAYLEKQLQRFEEIEWVFPRQANGVFVKLPQRVLEQLHRNNWQVSVNFQETGATRFMCSWQTTIDRLDALIQDIQAALG